MKKLGLNLTRKDCPALVLMTRWHAPNRCKTRLSKAIGSTQAALVQQKLSEHTFKVAKALEEKQLVEVFIAVTGISGQSARKWVNSKGFKNMLEQGEGSLGLRMRRQFLKAQQNNKSRTTILIGTDLPTLSERDLIDAIEDLKGNQIVLGPSNDGGYWLIGMSGRLVKPVAIWPFIDIPWGSDRVLMKTLKTARIKKTNYSLLSEQNDLDILKDLDPWIK